MGELQSGKDIGKKTTDNINVSNKSKETARQYHERMAYKIPNYVEVVVTQDNAGKIIQEFIDKLNQRSVEWQKQLNADKKPGLVQDFENWRENPAHCERIQVNMMRAVDRPARATSTELDYSDRNMANLNAMKNAFVRHLWGYSNARLKGILRNTEGCIDNIVFFSQHRGGAQGYDALVSIDNALTSLRRNKAIIDEVRWNGMPNIADIRQSFDLLNNCLGNALDPN